jgi:hypothetical protein
MHDGGLSGSIITTERQPVKAPASFKAGVVFGLSLLFPVMATAQDVNCNPAAAAAEPVIEQSISLNAVQRELQACQSQGNCQDDILKLYNVTQISGYVVDANAHDIILFGSTEANAPALYIEDFVVALKNALHQYTHREGNTLYYSNPGVSIDPDPKVLQQLNLTASKINSLKTNEERDAGIDGWCKQCELPQNVRVMGIPFDSHFAQVMVEADYLMKRIADGTAQVDAFESLSDMSLHRAIDSVQRNSSNPTSTISLNRFWFFPGTNAFFEDARAVLLGRSDVILLDEAQYVSQEGQIAASGRVDPLARKFACNFSRSYAAVAADPRYHIYAELEGLFRWVALAQRMVADSAFDAARFSPTWLSDGFRAPPANVPHKLAGIATVKKWDHVAQNGAYREEISLRLPSCGGVDIAIDKEKMRRVRDTSGLLPRIAQAVIAARPNPNATHWQVTMK